MLPRGRSNLFQNEACPFALFGETCKRLWCPFNHRGIGVEEDWQDWIPGTIDLVELTPIELDKVLKYNEALDNDDELEEVGAEGHEKTNENVDATIPFKAQTFDAGKAIKQESSTILKGAVHVEQDDDTYMKYELEKIFQSDVKNERNSNSDIEEFRAPGESDSDFDDPDELREACYQEWLRSEPLPPERYGTTSTGDPTSAKLNMHLGTHKSQAAEQNLAESSSTLPSVRKGVGGTLHQTMLNRYMELPLPTTQDKSKNKMTKCTDNLRQRVAHTPKRNQSNVYPNSVTKKARSDESEKGQSSSWTKPLIAFGSLSKIGVNIRQHTLDQLFKACEVIYENPSEASKRALSEELALANRHQSKAVYIGASANCLKRLRDEVSKLQDDAPSKSNTNDCQTTHLRNLVGPSKSSWSIQKRNQPALLAKVKLYQALLSYLLTPLHLLENGYPRRHPNGLKGAVYINKPAMSSTKFPNIILRTCERCNREYRINKDMMPVKPENCSYHPGRVFRKRAKGGTSDSRYNCCDGELGSMGCCVANIHVSCDQSNELYGFMSAIRTHKTEEMGNDPWDIVAIDCEMVYTTYGTELARATFISADKTVLYDKLVKPTNPIIDYNTRYSGITEQMMENVTTTLTDVQAAILTRIRPNTIFIGHSLESDLLALKLVHEYVIDTSVLMPHKSGPPLKRALRTLASEILGKIIQSGEGHDSTEDAITALEVVLWKAQGDRFAAADMEIDAMANGLHVN